MVGRCVDEVGDEIDDVISGGFVADVVEIVGVVRGEEDQVAGAGAVGLAVDVEFDVAVLDEEHFFPGVVVNGVGVHAGAEGGDVDFEFFEGGSGVVEDGAGQADGSGADGERIPIDEGGAEDVGVGRGRIGDGDGGGHGGECIRGEGGCDRGEEEEGEEFHVGGSLDVCGSGFNFSCAVCIYNQRERVRPIQGC